MYVMYVCISVTSPRFVEKLIVQICLVAAYYWVSDH